MTRYVCEVSFLDTLEGIEVTVCHCLDDELLVLRKEEEATTLSLRFTSLKDHSSIRIRVKGLFQNLVVVAILLAQEGEDIWRVFSDLDVLIDDKLVLELCNHRISLA